MGVKVSKQYQNKSIIVPAIEKTKHDEPINEKEQNKMQTVEYDLCGRAFSYNAYLIEDFFKGFFLNEDLQCAYVANCNVSFWAIYELTEKANSTVKYRIFKTFANKESGWGVVKSDCEENLNQVGIVRSAMEIEIDDDAFYSRNDLFRKKLSLFYSDGEYKTLKLKKVNTTDFSKLKEILNEISNLHADVQVKTKTLGQNGQQFDYIITKNSELLPVKKDYFA